MKHSEKDQIKHLKDKTLHRSAGGFLFYRDPRDQVLYVALLEKDEKEGFLIPKGHIKKTESQEEAALREIKEELSLGVEPRIVSKVGIIQYSFKLDNDTNTHDKEVHIFVFELLDMADLRPNRSEGFISAQWVPLEEALQNMAFDRESLAKAREEYLKQANV